MFLSYPNSIKALQILDMARQRCCRGMWKSSLCMMTSSYGNIFRVTGRLCGEFTVPGEFPTQRPVTRSFDVLFDLCSNKRLSKLSWGWWFETPSCPLWRDCNGYDSQSLCSLRRHLVMGTGIPIINRRPSSDRLEFIMEIPIGLPTGRRHWI